MNDVDINWLAVVAAALAPLVLGALWYSPVLFADRWLRAIGKTREALGDGPGALYGLAIVHAALASIVLAVLVDWAGADTWLEGLVVGALVWVVVATTSLLNSSFAGRPIDLWALDAGYHLLSLLAIGAILGAWQ